MSEAAATLTAEKERFCSASKVYYENTTTNAQPQGGPPQSTNAASANKTIETRRQVYGPQAMNPAKLNVTPNSSTTEKKTND